MMSHVKKGIIAISYILSLSVLMLTGCSGSHDAYVSQSTTIRDNTPRCLVPEAPGTITSENSLVLIDSSNSSEGYIMVRYLGDSPLVKLQIIGPDYMPYTYDITDNNIEAFPISAGNGTYQIQLHELVAGTEYSTIFSEEQTFNVTNEHGAFLYPNQYIHFTSDNATVVKASEIVANAHDDLEAINQVYNYLVSNFTYDMDKANNAQGGYIPDIDEILNIKTGICVDYATLMTAMLRSQGIPTRMEVGYAGTAYHAWISTYAENIGWINGIIEFNGVNWSLMDPTVASNSGEEALKNFIGDGKNYYTKYIY